MKEIKSKAEQFVKKYPLMFSEDKEWWVETLAEHFKIIGELSCPGCRQPKSDCCCSWSTTL